MSRFEELRERVNTHFPCQDRHCLVARADFLQGRCSHSTSSYRSGGGGGRVPGLASGSALPSPHKAPGQS